MDLDFLAQDQQLLLLQTGALQRYHRQQRLALVVPGVEMCRVSCESHKIDDPTQLGVYLAVILLNWIQAATNAI